MKRGLHCGLWKHRHANFGSDAENSAIGDLPIGRNVGAAKIPNDQFAGQSTIPAMNMFILSTDASRYRRIVTSRFTNSSSENMVRTSGASGSAMSTINRTNNWLGNGTSFISLTIAKLESKSAID